MAKADPTLEEFLKDLDLGRYLKALADEEVTDVLSLRYLHSSDFRHMGFSKVEIGRMKEALRKRNALLKDNMSPSRKRRRMDDVSVAIIQETLPEMVEQIGHFTEQTLRSQIVYIISNVPEAAVTMRKLLDEMKATRSERQQHCVRCHRDYDLAENREDSCKMRHIGTYERFATPSGWDSFGYRCCGPGGSSGQVCFVGRHTVDKVEAWKYLYASEDDLNNLYFPSCDGCGATTHHYNHDNHDLIGHGEEEEEEEEEEEDEEEEGHEGGEEEGEEEDEEEEGEDEEEEDEEEDDGDESINSDEAGSGDESDADHFQGDSDAEQAAIDAGLVLLRA